jgi:hypothetical protein
MDARGSSTLERERWSGNAGVASRNVHRGWMRETQFGEQEGSGHQERLVELAWLVGCAWALGGKRNKQETERGGRTKSRN